EQKFTEKLKDFPTRKEMFAAMDQQRRDIMHDTQSLLASSLAASEKRVIHEICGFIDDALLPQINDLQRKTALT
ncbi:hypothetical protein EBT25_14525, partial [bacterium]|nr:hypothetical protein [bacterium]